MSEKLPRVDAKKVEKSLKKLGFRLVRQSGSHRIYKNPEGKRVTIPYHSKKDTAPETT
ncbi:MAG: type II toxin-antitoxin system HicA family toxin [Candidatus Altiarchaeota archaeon]|nr:type II toxin-antitoxin system HicA family toxin [Candidatus Altiarchaeota archaeon]